MAAMKTFAVSLRRFCAEDISRKLSCVRPDIYVGCDPGGLAGVAENFRLLLRIAVVSVNLQKAVAQNRFLHSSIRLRHYTVRQWSK